MLTQEILKELLTYYPLSGNFRWNETQKGGKAKKNKIAGYLDKDNYVRIKIKGKLYGAHRLAFLYMTGNWPEDLVHHKNDNRKDNKWTNLKDSTNLENSALRPNLPNRNNQTNAYGVYLMTGTRTKPYQVRLNNKYHTCFETIKQATDYINQIVFKNEN